MAYQVDKRHFDCEVLPKGWKREEVLRRNGLTTGKVDVYYYSPCGKKFRSKPQLARFIGDAVDLSSFDFRTGKMNPMLIRKHRKTRSTLYDYSRGIRSDASLVPPIRQTASIFKQPVTVVKTQPTSKSKTDLKHGTLDKPKQVFWENRLQGLVAYDAVSECVRPVSLPDSWTPVGPAASGHTVLQSLATALHLLSGPITGQEDTEGISKNPAVYVDPNQPLVAAVKIQDEDILAQEQKVDKARQSLQKALCGLE